MKFEDVFRKSFLQGYSTVELSTTQIIVVLAITTIIGLYIFFCYRLLTQRTFYSKTFNASLVLMAVLTAGIILTIQSSVVVSLGMVGALSIVRFRTAVKDPIDLVFLFWSIGVGIMCGAGLAEIAIFVSFLVAILLYVLDRIPVARAPMMLVISGESDKPEQLQQNVQDRIAEFTKIFNAKSITITNNRVDMVIELRIHEYSDLIRSMSAIQGVSSVSLLSHDGEVTF